METFILCITVTVLQKLCKQIFKSKLIIYLKINKYAHI